VFRRAFRSVAAQQHPVSSFGSTTTPSTGVTSRLPQRSTPTRSAPTGTSSIARLFAIVQGNALTFPGRRMTIERLIARGDEVVAMMTVTGTHRAVSQRPVNGGVYLGVAPTARSLSVLHTDWLVVKDGCIVEHRATRDDLGMSRHLGLLPPAPARPPSG
jgi:predicted ester cyclase